MSPKEKLVKILQKSLSTKSPSIARELVELEEKILDGVKGDKGEKGDDGYTPIKGKDYFDGKDGEKGEKGDTTIVEKIIEKTEVIRETPIVTNEVKEVAIHETPEEIRAKLESLKDEDRLDASAIKNLPEFVETKVNGGGWRNLFQLHDVTFGDLTNGDTLVYNSTTGQWENGASSGGGSFATLTGDPYDNANLTTALNAKQDDITLTTTGSSGASTFIANTLNIPNYTLAGLGGANTALSNLSSVAINTDLLLGTSDTGALGSTSKMWSDLFLASGSVINWNAGDMTLTHSANLLTLAGGNMNVAGTLSADTLGISSLKGVFGERFLFVNEFSDVLWRADKRFTVTSSWGGGILANLFKGGFENTYTITPSVTDVININLANQSGVPAGGVTYPEGKFYVHFYYTNNNYSAISARVKFNGSWTALSAPVDISTVVGDKVLEFSIPGANYLTDIELTITTNGSDNVLVTALNYVCNRWTAELELPYFDKFALSNSIMGNTAFRTVSQTTSANINADGDWYMGVGGTGGHFGIGTSTPGVYHLNVAGDILGNSIYTASGNIFGSLGIAYLRAGSTNPTHINDTASGDVNICVGGGDLGVGEQYPTNRLHVKALSATTSYNLLNIDGGATGFSGANDTGAYSIIFSGCAYQTSIVQVIGAKIQFEKANTWNYADTPTGTRSIVNFYASAGTPNSPTSVKFLSGYWDNTVRLPSLDTDATAPTTSGTTKMVITDANGQLSFADIPGGYTNLTQFVAQTAWRIFYSDGSGDVQELALGGAGTYLQSAGASSVPTWATPAGSGDVVKVGTPVNNQVGVWTGDGTLEGDADLTFDTSTNTLATGIVTVTDDAYAAGWNGSTAVPTKNAIYDKIESMAGISRTQVTTSGSLTLGSTSATDYVYYVAGAHTLSMPSPNNNRYTIKNNHSANITIDTAGAELIEGAASISIAPGSSVDVVSDTTNWYIV